MYMKHKHYIITALLLGVALFGFHSQVSAVDSDQLEKATIECERGTVQVKLGSIEDYKKACETAGLGAFQSIKTSLKDDSELPSAKCIDTNDPYNCTPKTSFAFGSCGTDNVGIRCMMVEILKFLSIGVGLAVVGGIITGGIVYSTSEGNPSKTQSGIKIISNSILALVLYFLMFAIINFLIPGGVLGG